MKVLQLCHKPPYPPMDGGTKAMNNITEGLLKRGHEVKVLTAYTHKHPLQLDLIPSDYIENTRLEGVFIDTRVNAMEAFASLITSDSYNVSRFFSTDLDRKLTAILKKEKFDIIHLESLYVTPYIGTIRRFSKAKIVLRSHNIEYRIWKDLSKGRGNIARKAYLKYLASKLEDYEKDVLQQVDGIAAISTTDYENFKKIGCKKEISNIPFGIDLMKMTEAHEPEQALCYIGSLDWAPNVEGLVWFLEDVWPSIRKSRPDLKFYIAGRNMPNYISGMKREGVVVVGEVPNAREFLMSKAVLVVPLLMSGGLRVRVLEAMSVGACVITTKAAANGLVHEAGKNLIIASTAREFVKAVDITLGDGGNYREIGNNAKKLIEKNYDSQIVLESLEQLYKKLLD